MHRKPSVDKNNHLIKPTETQPATKPLQRLGNDWTKSVTVCQIWCSLLTVVSSLSRPWIISKFLRYPGLVSHEFLTDKKFLSSGALMWHKLDFNRDVFIFKKSENFFKNRNLVSLNLASFAKEPTNDEQAVSLFTSVTSEDGHTIILELSAVNKTYFESKQKMLDVVSWFVVEEYCSPIANERR